MPTKTQKLADSINAEEKTGSEVFTGSASETGMVNESELMHNPSVEYTYTGVPEIAYRVEKAREELSSCSIVEDGAAMQQLSDAVVMSGSRSSHGVESEPNPVKGKSLELGNSVMASCGMIEATDDRCDRGRSLRSSPRTGKPSTRRREAVNTVSRQEEGLSDPVNTGFIPDMQRKLYGWSRNNPDKVFKDLYNLITDQKSLAHAWKQLSRNQGARTPGVDGLTRKKIEVRAGGVEQYLKEVGELLRSGTYVPQPVKQKLIEKPGKPGQFRALGIPVLTDRLVQMALKNVLEPIFEADFYPTSYGFRRGRSTLDALSMIQRQLEPRNNGASSAFDYVIEGDIKGCFDNIDHHILMDRVRKRIGDRKALDLILKFLKAGIMAEGSIRHPVAGTPQGGIVSPLLANILLTGIDERYGRWTPRPGETSMKACTRRSWDRKKGLPTFYCVRYADDFIIMVTGSKEDAEEEKRKLAEYLHEELKLELSPTKTLVTHAEDGFEFLGYRVIKERSLRTGRLTGKLLIPKEKLQLLRNRLKAQTSRNTTGKSLQELLKEMNPKIIGWYNYYKYATGAWKDFMRLDWWLWHRIQRWLRKKHKRVSSHEIRQRFAVRESQTRWTWGEGDQKLKRFGAGERPKYLCRGTNISNGWNDEIDNVKVYREAARPISGYTWLGELF